MVELARQISTRRVRERFVRTSYSDRIVLTLNTVRCGRSPWSDECSPFRRNDDNFKLTLPRPDLQYYHEHVDLIVLMNAINLNELNIPELMKGECKRHEEAKDTALSSRLRDL
jgi:hypothetical protein